MPGFSVDPENLAKLRNLDARKFEQFIQWRTQHTRPGAAGQKQEGRPVDHTDKLWIGVGAKSGGQLLIGGVESVTAVMVNLANGETFDLEVISSRWGLGLGGSASVVVVIGFGFIEPYDLHAKSLNDWGVNVAFTEKFISKSVLQSLVYSKHWIDIYKRNRDVLAAGHVKSAFKDVQGLATIRNGMHTMMAGLAASQRQGIVIIELPMLGVGLEVSAYLTRGTMYVSNSSDPFVPARRVD